MTPLETVQELFARFAAGDIAAILARVAPDCRWSVPGVGAIPNAGVYTGPSGAAEFFTRLAASEEVTRFEPLEYFTSGETVVVRGYEECRVKPGGAEARTNWMMMFRLREGMLVEYESFYDTAAYAAAHALLVA